MNTSVRVPAVILLGLATATAQEWRALSPGVRQGAAYCYDPVRGVTVMFSGATQSTATVGSMRDTWEWNGEQWNRRETANPPRGRLRSVMAFDPGRGVCILFGGWDSAFLQDTWEWDGLRWRQLQTTNAPLGGEQIGMATDFARGRIVLHRGSTTWEWDGTDWRGIPASSRPGAGPVAWDPVRRRVAAFAGNTHWEWDGANWTQIGVVSAMTPRSTLIDSIPTLAFDSRRSRLQLFGGVVAGSFTSELWEWDGVAWSQRPSSPGLGRCYHGGVFDERRGRLVVIAGRSYPEMLSDVWEWDGSQWHDAFAAPEPSYDHSMASDPANGRMLTVATGGRTYEWRGSGWTRHAGTIPTSRQGVMAFDSTRGMFVHVGGLSGSTPVADVHEWTQGTWVRQTSPPPPARAKSALAFDPVRQRLVMFGGLGTTRILDDTWEYDGAAWREIVPTTRPPLRQSAGMAFDAARGRVVLYGGWRPYTSLADMWEWSGSDWTQLPPAAGPGSRDSFTMAAEPGGGTIVVHGGMRQTSSNAFWLQDTWEWNGTTWNLVSAGPAAISYRAAMASDGTRLLVFGGVPANGGNGPASATTYALSRRPGRERGYGSGCSGSAPAATLVAANLPFAGNRAFDVTISDAAAMATCSVALSVAPDNASAFGCTLLVRPGLEVIGATTSASGVGRISLPIPANPWMLGVSVYAQGFVVDSRGPVFGMVWTAGLEITVGT